jgi:hypothetical protein
MMTILRTRCMHLVLKSKNLLEDVYHGRQNTHEDSKIDR